jgi:methylmalonyl-CoA/ethylmalonyl-CoA epimerase
MIYLEAPDLDARLARLRSAGVEVVAEPHDIFTDTEKVFGGAWRVESQAFIRDSEGNLIGLVSHRA